MSNSGKVKCTCGWSWNKSDSSKKDMYVCHECGRDNSNNMKNGGWLDNYNDSEVSLPEGFVGMGNNTKGRNYSPAWGGQFEDGGELTPIAQNGTRADSLFLLKNNKIIKNLEKSGYKWTGKRDNYNNKVLWKKEYDFLEKNLPKLIANDKKKKQKTKPYSTYIDKRNKLLGTQDWLELGNEDYYMPKQYIHPDIVPQFSGDLKRENKDRIHSIYSYGYDDLAITPFDMLTPEQKKLRVKKYGTDGVPKSYIKGIKDKLNKDPEIKPTGAPIYNKVEKRYEWEGTLNPLPKQQKVEAINLPPMQNQSVSFPNQEIDVRTLAQAPTSFDISSQRYNMQGPSDYYNYNEEGVDYETALRAQQAAEKYNTDIEKRYGPQNEYRTEKSRQEAARRLEQLKQDVKVRPNYQMGGSVYPVNYVPEAQMGASIPGAVGFSYARTQSPAPSNGKYAKKTMASAQKGKTIPKLDISQLDLTIPKSTGYAWADNIVKKNKKGLEKVKELKTKVDDRGIAAIKKQYKVDDATAKKLYNNSKNLEQEQSEVRSYTPQSTLSKTWDVITNPMTALGYVARNEDLPDNFTRGDRSNLDMATDVINPAAWANYGALGLSDLSNVPGQLLEGDFQGAGESTLIGTLNMLGAVPLGQELKPFIPSALKTLPKAKNVKDALGTFRGIPTERSLPRLSPEELKVYRQVQEVGRMRATNKPISEQYRYAVDQNLPEEHLQKVFGRGREEIERILPNEIEAQALRDANPIPISERFDLTRPPRQPRSTPMDQEANDLFNQMPESLRARIQAIDPRRNTQVPTSLDDMFAQLDAGTHSSQTSGGYGDIRRRMGNWDDEMNAARRVDPEAQNAVRSYSDDYDEFIEPDTSGPITTEVNQSSKIERATDALEQFSGAANRIGESQAARLQNKLNQAISEYPYYEGPVLQNVPSLSLSSSGSLKNVSNKVGKQSFSGIGPGDVFTGSLNTSHSSYLPQLKQIFKYNQGAPQFFGYQPMNTLGFLNNFNYSVDDIAKYLNTEIDDQIRRGIVPDNILRPYATNKPGARYQSVQLPHYGIKQNPLTHREGGVIKDDRGQWDHPGEITEINSNEITMGPDPITGKKLTRPLIGVSDTGDVKIMKPGKNYKFKGKKVTEYPMAKNGLRQEQKGLVNLDQLTNFTNYNTKQPGGWLDKY